MSWTFLSNHGHVVIELAKDPEVKLSELAIRVGVTERHARAIIKDLRNNGYIRVTRQGRRNHYEVLPERPLRHARESEHSLSELLRIFQD